MIRVVIAHDRNDTGVSLTRPLADAQDIVVTGSLNSAAQLLEWIKANDADVAVLDLSMPGNSLLDVLTSIRTIQGSLPVLVVTWNAADQYAVRVMRTGASGYVSGASMSDELARAIRIVAQGRKFVTESVAEQLALFISSPQSMARHELLSDREYQVLMMLASGSTVTEIADQLSLSVKTISTYRSRVLEKMHLHTNIELVEYVKSNQLNS
ncbi:MAG: response regulator transcription factor [bacterium]|nr:response regulator transcription factor [bacterium]